MARPSKPGPTTTNAPKSLSPKTKAFRPLKIPAGWKDVTSDHLGETVTILSAPRPKSQDQAEKPNRETLKRSNDTEELNETTPVIDRVTSLTDRFDRALLYATHVHGGQARKGTSIPYISHLLVVSATVLEYGGDEELAIAALLHDSVEDQGGKARLEDVRNRFGERVAKVVEACSDSLSDTTKGEQKEDWHKRKEAYLAHLENVDDDVLRVSLADKVHNARAILRDLQKPEVGGRIWTRFNQSRKDTLWYYCELAKIFRRRLPGQLADELHGIVVALENRPA